MSAKPISMSTRPDHRAWMLGVTTALLLAVWVIPVAWGLLTSFKSERDVLAYPPKIIFTPTLANYRDVLFGPATIAAQPVVEPDRHHRGDAR